MNRLLRSLSFTAVALLAAATSMTSCTRQGEGERCDLDNGVSGADTDCDDGLVCTDPSTLQYSPAASVCCPADGTHSTLVCTPKTNTSSTSSSSSGGGSGGSGGGNGNGGSGGATTSGSGGSGGNG